MFPANVNGARLNVVMRIIGMFKGLIPKLFRWGLISRWLIALCLWAASMEVTYSILSPWPIMGAINSLVVGLCLVVLLVRIAERFSPGKPIWMITRPLLHAADVVALAFIVCGVWLYLNGVLSPLRSTRQIAEIASVAEDQIRVGEWWPAGRLTLKMHDADRSSRYVFVNHKCLERILEGEVVAVWVYEGAFGLPWVDVRTIVPDHRATSETLASSDLGDSVITKTDIKYDIGDQRMKQAYEKAKRYFALEPEDFYLAMALAGGANRGGNPALALQTLEPFVSKFHNYKLYTQFGFYLRVKGDMTRSIDYLKAAVGMDPNNGEAYYLLGYTYKDAGLRDEARLAFTRLAELTPQYAYLLNNL
jgi:hypothetical protein